MDKLLNTVQLSKELGPPVRTIRAWQKLGIIPVIKIGERQYWYDPVKVRASLERLELKAVGQR